MSAVTATSSTEYPWASYLWIGVVVSAAVAENALLEDEAGRARERWMARSEEPVRRYVPG